MRGCLIADTVHLFRLNRWLLELDSGSYGFPSSHVWMWELNCELPDVQAQGRGTTDQIANIHWIIKKAREFQKNIYFCFIDYAKAFDCVDHNKLWAYSLEEKLWPT